MPKFTRIPMDTFDNMQLDAGVLLRSFDPEGAQEPDDDTIICATRGGITVTCVPKYSDMGEDVDNCPAGTMELKKLEGWSCGIKFVSLGMTADDIRLALGAADVSSGRITPRRNLETDDFADIWWVGDTVGGGLVAVRLKNALSEKGLELQSSKNSKGSLTVELKGHVSVNAQDETPMEFYSAV